MDEVAVPAPSVVKALVDQDFKQKVVHHGRGLGVDVEIIERNAQDVGFVTQPIRWRVEQTFGILMLHRRLVRDYESRLASSVSRVYWAETDRMTRRLTGTTATSWRAPADLADLALGEPVRAAV